MQLKLVQSFIYNSNYSPRCKQLPQRMPMSGSEIVDIAWFKARELKRARSPLSDLFNHLCSLEKYIDDFLTTRSYFQIGDLPFKPDYRHVFSSLLPVFFGFPRHFTVSLIVNLLSSEHVYRILLRSQPWLSCPSSQRKILTNS